MLVREPVVIGTLGAAAIVAALAAGFQSAWPAMKSGLTRPNGPYQSGASLEIIGRLDSAAGRKILLIWLDPACSYCTESVSFYKRLSGVPQVRTVVVGTRPKEELESYLNQHDFRPEQILSVGAGEVKFRSTPALAIVLSSGAVLESWTGQLTTELEDRIFSKLRR